VGARLGLRDCVTVDTAETSVTLLMAALRLSANVGPDSELLTSDAKAVGEDCPASDKSTTKSKLTVQEYVVRYRGVATT
jgi:hypothetical protein